MCSLRDKLQRGFFREIEDFIIIVGVKLFGTEWGRIADFIPSRTPMQIHSRYNTFLKANFENWTEDEDMKLLQMVKTKASNNWKGIGELYDTFDRKRALVKYQSQS